LTYSGRNCSYQKERNDKRDTLRKHRKFVLAPKTGRGTEEESPSCKLGLAKTTFKHKLHTTDTHREDRGGNKIGGDFFNPQNNEAKFTAQKRAEPTNTRWSNLEGKGHVVMEDKSGLLEFY